MTAAQTNPVDDEETDALLPNSPLWKTVRPLGSRTNLVKGETLPTDEGFLLESGAVALFSENQGRPTCVGLMRAGELVGLATAISAQPSPIRAVVVADGSALRFSRLALRREWETSAFFREAALFEAQLAAEAARQWSLCILRHGARQRLATLLLWLSRSQAGSTVWLSQETAAGVLNVRRTTVTTSASELQSAGAIEWRRGGAEIIDRRELSVGACPCVRRPDRY